MVVVVEANQASEHCLIECRYLQYSQINIPGIKFAPEGENLTLWKNFSSVRSSKVCSCLPEIFSRLGHWLRNQLLWSMTYHWKWPTHAWVKTQLIVLLLNLAVPSTDLIYFRLAFKETEILQLFQPWINEMS